MNKKMINKTRQKKIVDREDSLSVHEQRERPFYFGLMTSACTDRVHAQHIESQYM